MADPYKIDRSHLPRGPWDDEPDRVEWRTRAGLPALLIRQPGHGALCGYVAVPPGHPLYGRGCVDADASDLRVHGGITYGDRCHGHVCHVPAPGEPDDVWWLGFDASHAFDIRPGDPYSVHIPSAVYRTAAYMRTECEMLAMQLRAYGVSDDLEPA